MQWLFDLFKEWAAAQGFLTASFVDRGDFDTTDFGGYDFNQDGDWHELDLSGIIPAGAKGVCFWFDGYSDTVESHVMFRPKGWTHLGNGSDAIAQVAGVLIRYEFTLGLGADRIIEYAFHTSDWEWLGLVVKNWWL